MTAIPSRVVTAAMLAATLVVWFRLRPDPLVLVVPSASPYKTLDDVLDDPDVTTIISVNSPRRFDEAMAEGLMALHALGPVGRTVAGRSGCGFACGV